MFDIGASELLLIVIVAVIVIGPKDMPMALRTAGRWIGKVRRVSGHFRAGIDAMVREAEMEEMEKKWRAQNEKVMRDHPNGGPAMEPTGAYPPHLSGTPAPAAAEAALVPAPAAAATGSAAAATVPASGEAPSHGPAPAAGPAPAGGARPA